MAEAPISISQHDWNRQKDNFIDLYHRRKLPLQSKNGGPSVIQTMRDEHNFCASLSQYEAQIRRWDMPKNLKRTEWARIIAKMDEFKSGGVECRLKLAGSLVSADKIKQKRRLYLRAKAAPNTTESLPGPFLWDSPRFTLEILPQDGQWSPYREEEAPVHISRHATLSSSIMATASRTLNVVSTPSNSSTVHCLGQRSIDKDATRRPVTTLSCDDALPLPWPRDNIANVESNCPTEHVETVLNPSQDTLAGAYEINDSPCPPDYPLRGISNVLGMDGGFALLSSSQEFILPISDAERSPYSPTEESLTWSRAEGIFDASIIKLLEESPFFLLEKQFRSLNITSTGQSEQTYLIESYDSGTSLPKKLTVRQRRQSSTSVLRETASVASIAQMIPDFLGQGQLIQNHQFNKFVDCLDSLLPNNTPGASGYTSVFDASSPGASRLLESPFHRAILYSTVNGFAGLSRLPELSLLQNYYSLVGLAKSHPSFAVRSFIDNAFSAAVWNHNAQAAGFLLRMTHGTSYATDVNKIMTVYGQVSSLPIEVALRDSWRPQGGPPPRIPRQCLETAEVLLKAGASSTAALRYLMSDWRCPEYVPIGFILQLLDRGAKPEWGGIQWAMQHANEARIELLLARIPCSSYQLYFQGPEIPQDTDQPIIRHPDLPLLACTALYLSNSTATKIIKSVLREWPRSEIEKHFPGTYERTMDYTLIHACVKGNRELVEILLPLIARVSSAALVAAIRSREQPLIELLLASGVNANDMPIYLTPGSYASYPQSRRPIPGQPQSLHPHSYNKYSFRQCKCQERCYALNLLKEGLSTPLAEAIRSRNQSLVQKLEYTLSRGEKWHIEHALEAAADVGDLDYLLMLLNRSSIMNIDEIYRKRALCLAIDRNRDDTAFALLNDGVDVSASNKAGDPKNGPRAVIPLLSAIRGNRKKLIEVMLEHEPRVSHPYYIRAAAFLGDMDMIKFLLSSQAAVSLRALRTALISGNEDMLNALLDHFWRRNQLFQFGRIGLTEEDAAISESDLVDLVRWTARAKNDALLVSFLEHGASAGTRVIEVATKLENFPLLEHLLAFAMKPSITLDAVIKLENQTLLRQWLSNGTGSFTESAFLHAMRLDKQSFAILMEAFRTRFPKGLTGWGGSLLKNAIRKGNSVLLRELLAARMDVNSFGEFKFRRMVARNGIRNDRTRSTPLGFAIYRKKGKNIEDVQMLLDAGSEPNGIASGAHDDKDRDEFCGWKTPLLLAIETGNLELIRVILKGGADINLAARNGRKRTPLQRACELCSLPMVELLLSWQADVNGAAAIRAGGTALQLTAIGGSIKIAKVLLQNGADVRAQPAEVHGRTPFEGAAEHGRLDMLKVIWDATFPEGMSLEEAGNAIYFARTNGHRICEEYIRYLVPTAKISELSGDKRGAWRRSLKRDRMAMPYMIPYDSDMPIGDESDSDRKKNFGSEDERSSGAEDTDSDDSSL